MVECKKCIHYNTCVKQFLELKNEGYYDETCPDITLEEHFATTAGWDSCDFFYEDRYAKCHPIYVPRTELPGPPPRVTCPNCHESLVHTDAEKFVSYWKQFKDDIVSQNLPKFCRDCGQALDWENIDGLEEKSNDS